MTSLPPSSPTPFPGLVSLFSSTRSDAGTPFLRLLALSSIATCALNVSALLLLWQQSQSNHRASKAHVCPCSHRQQVLSCAGPAANETPQGSSASDVGCTAAAPVSLAASEPDQPEAFSADQGPFPTSEGCPMQCDSRERDAAEPANQTMRLDSALAILLERMSLTPMDEHIARMMLLGHTYSEIAQKVFLSERAIKNHARRICEKAGTKTRAEFECRCRTLLSHLL